MTWENILKKVKGYTEDELTAITADWEDVLHFIFDEEPEAETRAKAAGKKEVDGRGPFGGYTTYKERIEILEEDWHKYFDNKKFMNRLKEEYNFVPREGYDPNDSYSYQERSYEQVDRTPPEYY